MDTKLTLKLDKMVIERAKSYAASQQRSLSGIIEAYLKSLTDQGTAADLPISPFVKSMSNGLGMPEDAEHGRGYSDYLADKYN
ncbi:DUF6364 family protein [Parapedobacter sp. 2B3]|uniref:DUF6364 family protein n=1 Tax=Parapedobacter sp. 2B3 TaxID=3342381 RepID=UPI0035B67F15